MKGNFRVMAEAKRNGSRPGHTCCGRRVASNLGGSPRPSVKSVTTCRMIREETIKEVIDASQHGILCRHACQRSCPTDGQQTWPPKAFIACVRRSAILRLVYNGEKRFAHRNNDSAGRQCRSRYRDASSASAPGKLLRPGERGIQGLVCQLSTGGSCGWKGGKRNWK